MINTNNMNEMDLSNTNNNNTVWRTIDDEFVQK